MLMMTYLQESVNPSVYRVDERAIVQKSCMVVIVPSLLPSSNHVILDTFQLIAPRPILVFVCVQEVGKRLSVAQVIRLMQKLLKKLLVFD